MMPHPERLANQLWQWPYLPAEWKGLKVRSFCLFSRVFLVLLIRKFLLQASPWLRMFQNARAFSL